MKLLELIQMLLRVHESYGNVPITDPQGKELERSDIATGLAGDVVLVLPKDTEKTSAQERESLRACEEDPPDIYSANPF